MGPDGETFVVAGWGLTKTRLIRVSNKGFWNNIYKKVYKLIFYWESMFGGRDYSLILNALGADSKRNCRNAEKNTKSD